MSKLAFIDTETTGLSADRHEIWEVALITDVERVWQLDPLFLEYADPIALSIGHFHERHYAKGNAYPRTRSEEKVWPIKSGARTDLVRDDYDSRKRFAQRFAELTHGAHLVGSVISFDEERLRKYLIGYGVQPSWHYHIIDVEALAVGYLSGTQGVEADKLIELPWKSDELSRAIGVDPPTDEDRHTALGDARWAKRIYERVMGLDA